MQNRYILTHTINTLGIALSKRVSTADGKDFKNILGRGLPWQSSG